MLQTLGALDARWHSAIMLDARKYACEKRLDPGRRIKRKHGLVLGFFEDLGLYLKRHVVDREPVWDKWSYYIERYWEMYREWIDVFRQETGDTTWYDKFEYLKNEMDKESRSKGLQTPKINSADLAKFARGETETETFHQIDCMYSWFCMNRTDK